MKYFTYELIAAANDWINQTEAEFEAASKRFSATCDRYHRELDTLQPRISKPAWNIFRSAYGPEGLHDARLLSLTIGDGLDFPATGAAPFRINRQQTTARIVFLGQEQDRLFTFELRGIHSMETKLFRSQAPNWCIGDLYSYEIVEVDKDLLQFGLLFASGATVVVQFRKLIFRRKRLKLQYDIGAMYE